MYMDITIDKGTTKEKTEKKNLNSQNLGYTYFFERGKKS